MSIGKQTLTLDLRGVEQERDVWKERAEQVEQDRDYWKTKYLEQERKIQNLESFQKAGEAQVFTFKSRLIPQASDLIERNESSRRSKSPTKVELESPVTSPVLSISYISH